MTQLRYKMFQILGFGGYVLLAYYEVVYFT